VGEGVTASGGNVKHKISQFGIFVNPYYTRPMRAHRIDEYLRFRSLLSKIRRERGLTQAQLAEKLHKPQSFISKFENGERRLDYIELRSICDALGISISEFDKRFESA
jgi:ribosome-binding protein aMBF1 (putative translation factor)